MAKERLYGWNGEMPAKPVTGQAQEVLTAMKAEPEEMRTGKEWTELIGPRLKTRQDPYRVVLYYVLILKSKGCVRTHEREIEATTRTEKSVHRVIVKTRGSVEEREVLSEAEPEPADPFAEVSEYAEAEQEVA